MSARRSLSFRSPGQSLGDILNSILMVEEFVAGVSFGANPNALGPSVQPMMMTTLR